MHPQWSPMTCFINLALLPAYVHAKSLQSCPAHCDHMDYSPLGSSVHGIVQARILEWLAMPFSRRSSWPRDGTQVSYVPSTGCWVLYHWHYLGSPSSAPWLRVVVFLNLSWLNFITWNTGVVLVLTSEIGASTCFLDQCLVLRTRFVVIISSVVAVLVTQVCLTLCDPMDYSPRGSSVHRILQAKILEWVAISFSRGSSRPRDWTRLALNIIWFPTGCM